MNISKAYQAAWESEFDKLSHEEQEAVKAAPSGETSVKLSLRATEASPNFWKQYYSNATLNRLAYTVWQGVVFGEQTMLDMMVECCDEAQFLNSVEEAL